MRDKLGRFVKGHKYLGKGKSLFRKGQHISPQTEFRKGQNSGSKNHNWKNGIKKDTQGYVLILKPKHPFANKARYVKNSRLVMEKYLGHYLKPEEIVHHINSIKDDDRPKNLKLFTNTNKHSKYHYPKGSKFGKNGVSATSAVLVE